MTKHGVPPAQIIKQASWMREVSEVDDTSEMEPDELESLREESAAEHDDDRLPIPPHMPGLDE